MILSSKRPSTEILSYSYSFKENFKMPSRDFYEAALREMEVRQIPKLETSYQEFLEGGLQTDQREYLRLTRERMVFDICAAPFGTGFFFSCRLSILPLKVSVLGIVILLAALFQAWQALVDSTGKTGGSIVFGLSLVLVLCCMQWISEMGLQEVDVFLTRLPVIGPLYERFFQSETYYRQDTRKMYTETVPAIVQGLVQQFTAAQGVGLPGVAAPKLASMTPP
jgi:hypothetical protein